MSLPTKLVLKHLSSILSLLGVLLGILILIISYRFNLQQYDLGAVFILSALGFIIFERRVAPASTSQILNFKNALSSDFINITYFILYAASVALCYLSINERPTAYFMIISIMGALVALSILSQPQVNHTLILIQIVLLSLNIKACIFFQHAGMIGIDIKSHSEMALAIAQIGHLTPEAMQFSKYISYPGFQLVLSISHTILSIPIKETTFISVVALSSLAAIFVYLIGKQLFGQRIGLLSLLIFATCDMFIVRTATSITPSAITLVYFLLTLYILIKWQQKENNYYILLLIALIALIISHQLSTLVIYVLLSTFVAGIILYGILDDQKLYNIKKHVADIGYLTVFAISLISYWIWASTSTGGTFFEFALRPISHLINSEGAAVNPSSAYQVYFSQYTILSNTLFHFGYLILLFLGIIGLYLSVSENCINNKRFSMLLSLCIVGSLIYGLPVSGIGNAALTTRWLIFLYLMLSILAGVSIYTLHYQSRHRIIRNLLTSVIVCGLIFFMITTPYICGDNLLYAKERWTRQTATDTEISAGTTLSKYSDSRGIITDYTYQTMRVFNTETETLILNDNLVQQDALIVVREYIKYNPVSVAMIKGELSAIQFIDPGFFIQFERKPFKLIYDNGGVKTYHI